MEAFLSFILICVIIGLFVFQIYGGLQHNERPHKKFRLSKNTRPLAESKKIFRNFSENFVLNPLYKRVEAFDRPALFVGHRQQNSYKYIQLGGAAGSW